MRFDPQVEALLPYLLMQVLNATGKRRGQLEYGLIANNVGNFSSRQIIKQSVFVSIKYPHKTRLDHFCLLIPIFAEVCFELLYCIRQIFRIIKKILLNNLSSVSSYFVWTVQNFTVYLQRCYILNCGKIKTAVKVFLVTAGNHAVKWRVCGGGINNTTEQKGGQ